MMRSGCLRRTVPSLVLLFTGMTFMPGAGSGQEEQRIRGDDVAVYNLAGTVEIVPGSGQEVVVQVTRGGRDAQRLEVDRMRVDGREALVIRYPSDQVVYPEMGRGSRTEIRVGQDGSFFRESEPSDSRRVRIMQSGEGLQAWADLRISVPRGQEFALFLAAGGTEMREVDGNVLIDTGSGAVGVRASRGELSIDTGSGAVTVDGFEGDLTVDTGSGRVEITEVRGDEVSLDTGSGAVAVAGVTAGSLWVDTGSGEISLKGISCPEVTLDTGSGSVEVELLADVDHLVIDTGSGSVTLWVPRSLGAEVEMDTGSGGIDLDIPLEVREAKRDYLRGILGDGVGTIRVDTGSGGIRIIGR
jgi:DUF4097 and DUF4098 domain-containing protein YvlB